MELTRIDVNKQNDKFKEQSTVLLNDNFETLKPEKTFGKRHLQVVNLCFLVVIAYYSRNSLSVAIIAMNDRNSTRNPDIPVFNWTNKNVVQSSFFFGYVPSQIFVSWLITRTGTKWLAVLSMVSCSIFGIFIPSIAYKFEDKGVMVFRILQGIGQGFVFPTVVHLVAQWVPPTERARLAGAVYAGRPMATVISMFFTGYIAGSYLGWPWIFYISNGIGLLWCISFALFSYDNPSSHPSISLKEKKYIENSIDINNSIKNTKIPWKLIATSIPFWAIIINQAAFCWGFWTQQTQMPTYMKYVMKFDIETSGTLSALPYLLQWLLSYFFSFISDYLLEKNIWSIGTARKTMNSIGMFIPAIIFVMLQNSGPDESTKAIVLLIIGIAINSASFSGFMINHIDLSPKFASILLGFSNGPSQASGFLAPLFVQAVVKNETDPNEWKYVFYTTAGIYIVAGLFYIFFASGEVQYWGSDKNSNNKKNGRLNIKNNSYK